MSAPAASSSASASAASSSTSAATSSHSRIRRSRSRSPSRERQRRRFAPDDDSEQRSLTDPNARQAAFNADAQWAGVPAAASSSAIPNASTYSGEYDESDRSNYISTSLESESDSDSDDDEKQDEAAASTSASADASSTAPNIAASSSSSAAAHDITALLPSDSSSSSSSAPHDSSLFGCRKVSYYKHLNAIDEGTYGVVHRARDPATGEIVALKKIKLVGDLIVRGFPNTSLREINILRSLRHRNIVQMRDVVTSGGSATKPPRGVFMVMDYAEHDLKALLDRMQPSTLPNGSTVPPQFAMFRVAEVKCLLKQLLEGMAYLHENWILHRDLKTANLLYNNHGELKICDFGLARRYGDPLGNYSPNVLTLWYRPPELLFGAKKYSTAVDMWSVGCIFGELLLGKPLFGGPWDAEMQQISCLLKILGTPTLAEWPEFEELDYSKTFSFTKSMPSRLREKFPTHSFSGANILNATGFDLLSRLLCYNPAHRISAVEALKHPYFSESPLPQSIALMPTYPSSNEKVREDHHTGPTAAAARRRDEEH